MKDELCKASHKIFKIKYHFVFCIKYRKDLFLEDAYVKTIKGICLGVEERYDLKFETIGFDEDHVHFMIQAFPRDSPSSIFQAVKSILAKELFRHHPDLKKELWGGNFWSAGGFVGTVGEGINAEVIRRYIENQGRKVGQLKLVDFGQG